MNQKNTPSERSEDQRAPYEPPAIEQSAGFERMMLGCTLTPDTEPLPCMGVNFSSV